MHTIPKNSLPILLAFLTAVAPLTGLALEEVNPKEESSKAEPDPKYMIPRLTGEELLCEIETDSYSGIYALDTKKANPRPVPLVSGGRSPQWGPKHKAFSFFRAGLVWVGDCEGRIQPAGLVPRNAQDFQMFWDPQGKAFALYTVPGWTRVFARSINFSEDLVVQRLKERRRINLKFAETIVMKANLLEKEERFLEVEDDVPSGKTKLPLAPRVRATQAVAFSPDASQFVVQVSRDPQGLSTLGGQLWLFKSIDFNIHEPGYSLEKYEQAIASNDYSRFYIASGLVPNATLERELTGLDKSVSAAQPTWSPDGTMLAYSRIDTAQEEVRPHILHGNSLEKDTAVRIPNYLPGAEERWAKRAVEVLFWAPSGDLFLIEATRDKIYRAKVVDNEFTATVFVEVVASGKPALLHPVLNGEWLAYTMSLDDAMTLHLKNTRTDEDRILPIAVGGSAIGVIRSLSW